jgi:hypothetical protein
MARQLGGPFRLDHKDQNLLEQLGFAILGSAAGATLILLGWRVIGAGAARKKARAAFLDECRPIFEKCAVAIAPTGFPRLSGRYRSRDFDIQALPDTLTFRKLPTLWLLVTLPSPMPVAATLDVMRRPTGSEIFSRFGTLPVQIETPRDLPADTAVRSDSPAGIPSQALLHPHLGVFDHKQVKELIVSPRGLRITWLAEEADRSRYLLFRDAEMGASPFPPTILRHLLDRLVSMADDLETTAPAAKEHPQ